MQILWHSGVELGVSGNGLRASGEEMLEMELSGCGIAMLHELGMLRNM